MEGYPLPDRRLEQAKRRLLGLRAYHLQITAGNCTAAFNGPAGGAGETCRQGRITRGRPGLLQDRQSAQACRRLSGGRPVFTCFIQAGRGYLPSQRKLLEVGLLEGEA